MNSNRAVTRHHGTQIDVKISSLRLDPLNPRLAEKHRTASQEDIADVLRMSHDVLPIAISLVDNGYFSAEPLLVIADLDDEDVWIDVEGNRRTAALKGLTDHLVREVFNDPRWDDLASESPLGARDTVPVVVHKNREAAQVEVGRTHVVGKLQWTPYAQARYVTGRIVEGKTFQEVAHDLGIAVSKVRDLYRDLAVADQAKDFGVSTKQLEGAFSLMTVAMRTTKIRTHIDAPAGSHVVLGEMPVPEEKQEELREVVQWIFGDEENEPKINDSRQISKLGKVVASDIGLKALRGGDSLEKAEERIKIKGLNPRDRLVKRLTAGRNALREATDDLVEFAVDHEIVDLVSEIESIANGLQETIDETEG
mgnify:CR=1 FL=1